MTQILQINARELNDQFIQSVKTKFGNRDLRIVIEEIEEKNPASQKEVFSELEMLRKKLSSIKVDPDIDLSLLANDVNKMNL